MLLKGNLFMKINSYGNILPRSSLLYIFEFQLVLFHGVSYPVKVCCSWETNFVGNIYGGIVLHGGGTNDHIPKGKEFYKMHFPVT